MQFWKLNISVLLVIFAHARGDPSNSDDQDLHSAVDPDGVRQGDNSEDVDAAPESSGYLRTAPSSSEEAESAPSSSGESDAPPSTNGEGSSSSSSGEADSTSSKRGKFKPQPDNRKSKEYIPDGNCQEGEYFWHHCNICYCYKEGAQACTLVKCLDPKPNPVKGVNYKKLREAATHCVPGETVTPLKRLKGCVCTCPVPSVLACKPSCFSTA